MFIETILAAFLLGFLACALVAALGISRVDRVHREHNRAVIRDYRVRAYRAELRRQHLASLRTEHKGTPYIAPLPTDVERLLVDIAGMDDHNGSRKAPELRVVS